MPQERGRSPRHPKIARRLQRSLASAVENSDFLLELGAEVIALDLQIEPCLQVEPEPVTGPKIPGQAERRIRGDRASTMHDLIDAASRHADVLGEAILRNAQWLENVERQDLAGPAVSFNDSLGVLHRGAASPR
jgi:hypothetical protein